MVITLTTGCTDEFYVAALKGNLLTSLPSVQVVEISHQVPPFTKGISYAAYMVKHCYAHFPKGSIHIISVASEYSAHTPFVAAHHDGHYFIGTDNGFFGLLFDSPPDTMVCIEKYSDDASPNYPAIPVFAPAAVHLANGGDITELGRNYTDYRRMGSILATMDSMQITGTITHINAFGNIITNITRNDFERTGKGRPFEILVQSVGAKRKINRINRYFHETSEGELLAVFNISGFLEIAQNKGNVANMLQLELNSNIIVKFFDRKN